jgi:transposase InsO family protein
MTDRYQDVHDAVVPKATGRAVCLVLVVGLREYGIPEELLTDNGKQFTVRFNAGGGEVMFDRICRENGITHRLTKPRSPTTTGKVERFHLSLRSELLDDHPPFALVAEAQAAIDVFRHDYNTNRPHQSLGMAFPSDRSARPAPAASRCDYPCRWPRPPTKPPPRPSRHRS